MSDVQEAAARLLRAIDRLEHNDSDILDGLPPWQQVQDRANELSAALEGEQPSVDEASYLRGWTGAAVSAAKPIRLFFSELTGRVYATRAYRELEGGRVVCTGQKFDVTEQIPWLAMRLVEFTAQDKQ